MCEQIILLRHTVFECYPICLSTLFLGHPVHHHHRPSSRGWPLVFSNQMCSAHDSLNQLPLFSISILLISLPFSCLNSSNATVLSGGVLALACVALSGGPFEPAAEGMSCRVAESLVSKPSCLVGEGWEGWELGTGLGLPLGLIWEDKKQSRPIDY